MSLSESQYYSHLYKDVETSDSSIISSLKHCFINAQTVGKVKGFFKTAFCTAAVVSFYCKILILKCYQAVHIDLLQQHINFHPDQVTAL